MQLSTLDQTIFILYLVVVLAIGVYLTRFVKTSGESNIADILTKVFREIAKWKHACDLMGIRCGRKHDTSHKPQWRTVDKNQGKKQRNKITKAINEENKTGVSMQKNKQITINYGRSQLIVHVVSDDRANVHVSFELPPNNNANRC